MTMADLGSPKIAVTAVLGALVLGGGAWGLVRWKNSEPPSTLPKDLTYESLKKKQQESPLKVMDSMRDAMRNEELTDEQRQELRQNMRRVWTETLSARVDEYFAATPEKQIDILDKHIDEFQARMKEFEARRKEWEAERAKEAKERGNEPGRPEGGPRNFGPQTQEERKTQSESRNPDQMARQMAYFVAVQKRAAERGITMPQWRRGAPGGGPGRGPGGGPGGGRPPGGP